MERELQERRMSDEEWEFFKGTFKERWPLLAEEMLDVLRDAPDMLVGRLQKYYRITREEAEQEYAAFKNEIQAPPV
jgi:hypothetical protein